MTTLFPPGGDGSDRLRIAEALFDLVAGRERFADLTEEELCRRAGLNLTAFRENFAGVEEALIWAFDRRAARFLEQVRAAYDTTDAWPDNLRAAAYQAAWWHRENPRALIVGARIFTSAGELARARRDAVLMACVGFIDAGRSRPESPPSLTRSTAESVIGGIVGSLYQALDQGLGRGLEQRLVDPIGTVPQFMFMAVRPYLGQEAALRELSMPRPEEPPVPCEPERREA